MKNIEISNVFSKIGEFLQIRGDASFKIRSYERAARVISDLTVDVSDLIETNKFQNIPGIGKTIESKTKEILETGTCDAYEKLKVEMGLDALELLDVQGVGGKTANRLYYDLEIKNVKQLEQAIQDGRLQGEKGFGKKTLQNITDSLQFINDNRGIRLISLVYVFVKNISNVLKECEFITRYNFTGEFRRREEVCRSLEIVIQCGMDKQSTKHSIIEILSEHKQQLALRIDDSQLTGKTPSHKPLYSFNFFIDNDFPVVIYLCEECEYETSLFLTTATTEHLNALPTDRHITINNTSDKSEFLKQTKNDTESEIYKKMGLAFIPPELRQFTDSIRLAAQNALPTLIELKDIRGDLHSHTEWSDGRNTMDEMVESAINQGLEYLGITDHSASSTVANGLDQKQLLSQIDHVRKLDKDKDGITLLAGSEVDIRPDGSLDFPDEILAQLDIVIASIHSQFNLSETAMTNRMIRAIENPFVMIIGHPTGRLLGSRPMYSINLEEVIIAAAENDTILEINASPSRLDLGPEYVRLAKEAGVRISINTDAHSKLQFEFRKFGINVARRSGLTKGDVINTYSLDKLRQELNINT